MPAKTNANYNTSLSPIIVPRTGLIHQSDRNELDWIRTYGNRQYSILISATYIKHRITELACEIIRETRKNKQNEINLLIVLKGAVFLDAGWRRKYSA